MPSKLEPRARIELATSSLPRMCSTPELPGPDPMSNEGQMERAAGIEPASSAWKAEVLPLYHARTPKEAQGNFFRNWWRGLDSNQRRLSQQIYSLPPLATREPLHLTPYQATARKRGSPKGRAIMYLFCALSINASKIRLNWSRQQESNPWPADYKSAALPSELCRQGWRIITIKTLNSSTI